jgi:glucose-1-phosphate cytidylyltransferase
MVPIGNRPILWHIMKTYAHYGHKDFILCLGYKGDMIKEYFRNYLWNTCDSTLMLGRQSAVQFHDRHNEEDWSVTLADTGEDSMTAYRVKQIQRYIPANESFLLTYGDGLSTIDINATIAAHRAAGKACTVSAVHPAGRFGALRIEEDGSILTFLEKPQFEEAYVNGGYMVCEHRLFDYLPNDPEVMLERTPMDALVRDGQLNAHKHEGFWQPMDTYQETQYLNKIWAEGMAPWKVW